MKYDWTPQKFLFNDFSGYPRHQLSSPSILFSTISKWLVNSSLPSGILCLFFSPMCFESSRVDNLSCLIMKRWSQLLLILILESGNFLSLMKEDTSICFIRWRRASFKRAKGKSLTVASNLIRCVFILIIRSVSGKLSIWFKYWIKFIFDLTSAFNSYLLYS